MKIKKLLKSIALSLTVALSLTACGAKANNQANESASKIQEITVKDGYKKDIKVPLDPKKIVVFDYAAADTIKALGEESKVIAMPEPELIPDFLKDGYSKVESAGGIKEPDMEKVNSLKPDLIIIAGRQEKMKEEFKKIAPTLYMEMDDNKPFESVKENIQTIAKILKKEDKAKDIIDNLDKQVQDLKSKAKNKKAGVFILNDGKLSAFGKGSRFGIVYEDFGFSPIDDKVKKETHGQDVSYEYVLEKNPDVMFVLNRNKAIATDNTKNSGFETNPILMKTNAGKNKKIIMINPGAWYLVTGGAKGTSIMIDDLKKGL